MMSRAVVALLMDEGHLSGLDEPAILMIKRAKRPGDPWSGDMALPGGRMEEQDRHAFDTALRETQEETGFDLGSHADYCGRLSDIITRSHGLPVPMVVTPYIFQSLNTAPTNSFINNHEVEERVWLPLSALLDKRYRDKISWRLGGLQWPLPCIQYGPYRIWGLTLMMLQEFTNILRKAGQ